MTFKKGHIKYTDKGNFKKGQSPWNIGLTKEIDIRLKKQGENHSKKMRELHAEGKIKIWSKNKTKLEFPQLSNSGVKKGNIPWNAGLKANMDERVRNNTQKRNQTMTEKNLYGGKKGKSYINDSLAKQGEKNPMFGRTLEKSPRWLGGKSFEPYGIEFNNQFKNLIRKRDNQICMNCGKHREQLTMALDVHHVNYDKEMSIPENCISLCRSCHTLTGINREYWTKLFQEKLTKLYGYQYSNNKIILKLT